VAARSLRQNMAPAAIPVPPEGQGGSMRATQGDTQPELESSVGAVSSGASNFVESQWTSQGPVAMWVPQVVHEGECELAAVVDSFPQASGIGDKLRAPGCSTLRPEASSPQLGGCTDKQWAHLLQLPRRIPQRTKSRF